MSGDSYVGAVPVRGQLSRLDRLVAAHETYWVSIAQQNPQSSVMRDFLRRHWDPWFSRWMETRPRLDRRRTSVDAAGSLSTQLVPASDDTVAAFVREAVDGLSSLRQLAAHNRIPTPDLGTVQHGVAEEPRVAGIFGDIASALKGAIRSVASFVKHPSGWFATIFPLMTMENQRYWSGKLAGSTGEKLYDVGVKAVAAKYLGPQGPALVETYNKVTEDAARGNLNAREILAKAPEIAKLAVASKQGPAAFRAAVGETDSAVKVSGDEGERHMSEYAGNYVGADGQSYPEVAAQAVRNIHAQHRSPYYGYIRSGVNQKIYLFQLLEDARNWFSQHVQLQPDHDYAAVFSASNLRAPVAGMEHFMRATVGCDPQVGSLWPFFLGLPLGGLGGYFLRRWQEQNPGQALPFVPPGRLPAPKIPPEAMAPAPKTSGDPYVGGPWLDLVGQDYGYSDGYGDPSVGGPWVDVVGQDYDYGDPSVGGPWLDIVGAQADDAQRRSWPQAMALIQSAISDVTSYAASYPAEAYVWTLDAPASAPYAGRAPGLVVILEGTTNIVPFSSQRAALDYMREVAQTRPVALAMFERSSQHWPNPVAWRKSAEPDHESVIAQHVASRSTTQASGTYAGADTVIGAVVDDVRRRAQTLANKRAGNVIGVIHTSKDGLWHTIAFRSSDDADDWLGTVTHDPSSYTYAAYYDKGDFQWPHPVNEKIGGARTPSRPGLLGRREIATTSGDGW